ncbi:MAG: polysaccharide deacetylase family protein [Sciscionella sp.]
MRRALALAGAAALGGLAGHALPAAWFVPGLRMWLRPQLAGLGAPRHVALTFDDGPHPRGTPEILRVLDEYGVRATFFVLGRELARAPHLGAELAAAGHEIGVHGWDHRCLALTSPRRTACELSRACEAVGDLTGTRPRWFRPPYGVLTTSAVRASKRLALTPVLWTCWGYDWSRSATPATVLATVTRDLRSGGTVLLHDSDVAAGPDSWKVTLGALPELLDHCRHQGWRVGPLRDHGVAPTPVIG